MNTLLQDIENEIKAAGGRENLAHMLIIENKSAFTRTEQFEAKLNLKLEGWMHSEGIWIKVKKMKFQDLDTVKPSETERVIESQRMKLKKLYFSYTPEQMSFITGLSVRQIEARLQGLKQTA